MTRHALECSGNVAQETYKGIKTDTVISKRPTAAVKVRLWPGHPKLQMVMKIMGSFTHGTNVMLLAAAACACRSHHTLVGDN